MPDRFIVCHIHVHVYPSGMCKCTVYLSMPYDGVQVHVCNNISVCTSASQYEHMHVYVLQCMCELKFV